MNNPLKSQIAANRERFVDKFVTGTDCLRDQSSDGVKEIQSFLTTSQTSLLQTAIAAVEGMKKKTPMQEGKWMPTDDRNDGFNSALSEVVELLKGGIE